MYPVIMHGKHMVTKFIILVEHLPLLRLGAYISHILTE